MSGLCLTGLPTGLLPITLRHWIGLILGVGLPLLNGWGASAAVRSVRLEGEVLKSAFDELTRFYHAENAHSMPVQPPRVP